MKAGQSRVIAALGVAQTLAWASSYYLPAILANPMAAELGVGTPWVFIAFSLGLLISGFLGPLSGRLIDLYGGQRILPGSNVLGLLMPARFMQAAAPFVFDVLLSRVGTAALGLTAGLGIASFLTLSLLRRSGPAAKA